MIIMPMCGNSQRFKDAGYDTPKYELPLHGKSVFDHVLQSFEHYFHNEHFLFIIKEDAREFVEAHTRCISNKSIISIGATQGQADTVYQGLLLSGCVEGPVTIFNIDTIRPGFTYPDINTDGYIEVFVGEGDHWSFAVPGPHEKVVAVFEKKRMSDLCSTGLYHFARASDFMDAYKNHQHDGEHYIAPIYNYLISHGRQISYHMIDRLDVIFCGTPAEYETIDKIP